MVAARDRLLLSAQSRDEYLTYHNINHNNSTPKAWYEVKLNQMARYLSSEGAAGIQTTENDSRSLEYHQSLPHTAAQRRFRELNGTEEDLYIACGDVIVNNKPAITP